MIGSSFNPAAVSVPLWRFTLVFFAMLVMLGWNALTTAPRTEDPQFPVPIVQIHVTLPGADPVDMEQQVVKPLEDRISGIEDLYHLRSVVSDGVATLNVEFQWDTDPDQKYDDVVREVNAIRGTLPDAIQTLQIEKLRTIDAAVRVVALVSDDLPWRRLEKIADDLREALDRVPSVDNAQLHGAPQSELRVAVDMGRLAELGLPVTAVADALGQAGRDLPLGPVHAGARRFNVKTQGAFQSLEEVEAVPVMAAAGRVVRVGDVATISWKTAEPQQLTRFNGKRAVLVSVTQQPNEDSIRLRANLDKTLHVFERTLPGNVRMERAFDQASNVERRLSRLLKDFGIAIALVMITLLPLGLRAGLVVMLSIPLSLLIGVIALKYGGYTINQLSIAGFVLSLGLLVDDSIVVTENIARHLREGKSRVQAAIDGTGQIAVAVVGCTATLLLAFLPLMFLPEGGGLFIKSMPFAVLATIAGSLLVSLTIVPFLASRLLATDEPAEGNAVLQRLMGTIHAIYRPALHWALEHPRRTLLLILALCLTAIPVYRMLPVSIFPQAGIPQFLVKIETPDGTALARTDDVLRQVEAELADLPGRQWSLSSLGKGAPQVYYNMRQVQARTNYAEVLVQLDDWKSGPSTRIVDDLRARLKTIPGAEIKVVIFENGPPLEAPIALRLSGPDLDVLRQLAHQAQAIMESTPGTRDVFNPIRLERTDLNLGVDEARAAMLGVPAGMAKRVTRLALTGEQAAVFRDPDGDAYPVTVRLPMDARNSLDALRSVYVPTREGAALPLGQIAAPRLESATAQIERYERLRQTTLYAETQTGYHTSVVTQACIDRIKAELPMPPGYELKIGGQAEAADRTFGGISTAIVVTMAGILAVLLLEFGRFKTVLVVAGIIPLGLFGAVMALAITNNPLAFTASVGIVALIGIEIKNSILLVDFTEQLRRQGVELREAIERAGEVRFLPILLTSATAIGGLVPLAVEDSGLFSPMAIAIIGGLVTSTVISRLATPVMYLLLEGTDMRRAVGQLFDRLRHSS